MKTKEVVKILEENKITNVGRNTPYREEPFVSQWYWQRAKMYPYKKTKAYYHGPREEWMYLMEDEDEQSSTQKKET